MRRATLAALFLVAAVPACAADFTFRVPVNIQDYERPESLPGGEAIVCEVNNVSSGGVVKGVGTGSAPLIFPASGSLNTTVTVDVNARPPARPQEATDYRCYFLLANAPYISAERSLAGATGITLKARPGTTPVVVVTGKIPK